MKTSRLCWRSFCFLILSIVLLQPVIAQDATTLYQEGLQLKKDNKTKDATDKFRQAIALRPDYPDAAYELGWCLNDQKDYAGAILNLRKARPSLGMLAKVHFELGYAFEKSGQTDSAIQSYNECLRIKPDYAGVYKQLGYIAYNGGSNYQEAKERFEKYESLMKTDIKDYLYWYRKGFVCNATLDYSNAMVALKKSLDYKSDYVNSYLELGFASSRLKQDDDAIGYYRKAIDLDPKSHIPYNGIGEVYRDNKKDVNEAMVWYKKTIAINPTERKANFGMGYCLNSAGNYAEAAGYLRTAIGSEKDYTAAMVELGYSCYMLGQDTEAIDQFSKALAVNPKNENAHYYACLVYLKQTNKAMAQKMVNELKALNSKHVEALQTRVNAL